MNAEWAPAVVEYSSSPIWSGAIGVWNSVTFHIMHPAHDWLWKNLKTWDQQRHYREMREQVEMEMNLKRAPKFWNTETGKWTV